MDVGRVGVRVRLCPRFPNTHAHTGLEDRGVCRSQTFKDFCRIPMGKPLVGSVVSHRRKSGCGLLILSRDFSRSFSHWTRRWQFCSISHCPRATAVSSSCRATCTGRWRGGRGSAPQSHAGPMLSQTPTPHPPEMSSPPLQEPGTQELQRCLPRTSFQNAFRAWKTSQHLPPTGLPQPRELQVLWDSRTGALTMSVAMPWGQ